VSLLRSLISRLRDRSPYGSESGVALVEFALVLPLLLVLLLGVLDFGKGFNYWIDETHLANEAARFAVVNKNPGTSGSLQNYVLSQADTAPPTSVTPSRPRSPSATTGCRSSST
jgi:Flp pilus assembly protein TadG